MSVTDELRKLLDERGVEWSSIGGDTAWFDSRGWTVETVADDVDGTMLHVMTLMTPTQAVEATLGRETCKLPETRIDHGSIEYNGTTEWRRCSECGEEVLAYPARFCPYCGREVVDG